MAWALQCRNVDIARYFHEKGSKLSKNGKTEMRSALRGSSVDGVRFLLEIGVNPNVRLSNDTVPICLSYAFDVHRCAFHDPLIAAEATKALLEAGAKPNFRLPRTGDTPLILAISRSQTNCATLLIEAGAKVCAINKKGETPLSLALVKTRSHLTNSKELVSLLIEKGADVNQYDGRGYTPLMIAAENDMNMIPVLIAAGANPRKRTKVSVP